MLSRSQAERNVAPRRPPPGQAPPQQPGRARDGGGRRPPKAPAPPTFEPRRRREKNWQFLKQIELFSLRKWPKFPKGAFGTGLRPGLRPGPAGRATYFGCASSTARCNGGQNTSEQRRKHHRLQSWRNSVDTGCPRTGRLFGALLTCLLYTSPSPRDGLLSRMPSSA